MAPSAPLPLHHPHRLALDRVLVLLLLELLDLELLLLLLDLVDLDSPVLRVRTRPATPRGLRQWHRLNFVSSRFHVDVVHVVLSVSNCATVML